ncbi:universal stress protein (plasmid) [Haloarcula hispanica N601]|uniref:Universal stress protein n=2 Tax=Haloarcula hispanica TaxID=51589 RepID=V5TSW6_HALHI|nr:universal stress protein [Haloarcula hispanica]AEM59182.1 universal stress protein [Haloarcula hispanica ATCC 33960]AHB68052.1 universal stress protein [Haloarcula hispanica N601]
MYDTIVVATDGSADANRAATHALEQAEQHGAELHAVFVVDTDRHAEPALSSMELETIEIEEWGNDELAEVAERGDALGVEVTTRCCHGKPYVEVISYADEVDADLIVLGYHGHSHTKTDQIGSVTDRVVQNAGRPVLVAT